MKNHLSSTIVVGILSVVCLMQACEKDDKIGPVETAKLPSLFPESAAEYATMIAPELGVVPTVVLDSMVEIPLYQNGSQVYGVFHNAYDLDNPSWFGKGTISGSAIQRYEGVNADGSPKPAVVWIAFLRNSTVDINQIDGSVQLIGYNQVTGATAFFESGVSNGVNNLTSYAASIDPVTFKLSGVMPGPNSTEFSTAYTPPPGSAQCVSCHQADPFITNPFITAAKIPGTNDPVIPLLGANAPYHVIGGENWDMRTIHIEGNACLSCHRVGLATVRLFEENGYDLNAHMPPNNPGSLAADATELMNAWINGVENTSNAEWVVPAVGAPGPNQAVGTDYPYQAEFNNPH